MTRMPQERARCAESARLAWRFVQTARLMHSSRLLLIVFESRPLESDHCVQSHHALGAWESDRIVPEVGSDFLIQSPPLKNVDIQCQHFLMVDLARIGLAPRQCECRVVPLDYRPVVRLSRTRLVSYN